MKKVSTIIKKHIAINPRKFWRASLSENTFGKANYVY